MINKRLIKALQKLRPGAEWVLRGEKLEWHDIKQSEPSKKEIQEMMKYLASDEYKKEEWREKTSITKKQYRIGEQLYTYKEKTLAQHIQETINQLPEPKKTIAKISQEEETLFQRKNSLLETITKRIGMSEEEVDDFFRYCLEEKWNDK